MLVGPVFAREAITAPRRTRTYVLRAVWVGVLLLLMSTAWQVLAGTQSIEGVGALARFAALVFQILAPLQLAVAVSFSALSAASAVALEKDRHTLVLLMLTRLNGSELVLGRLLASLLNALMLVLAALPAFMLLAMLGGISFEQIAAVMAVTLAASLAAASLGSTIALWRDKTFQSLSMTALALALWTVGWEAAARGAGDAAWLRLNIAHWAAAMSPWHATLHATQAWVHQSLTTALPGDPVVLFVLWAVACAVLLNALAIWRLRAWNMDVSAAPRREGQLIVMARPTAEGNEAPRIARQSLASASRSRRVWDNPVLWREVATWAYGRKVLLVRGVYWAIFAACAAMLHQWLPAAPAQFELPLVFLPLGLLSLLLVNMQAVTALTSERDNRALDLLLVTDLSSHEFVLGKLAGVLFNTKEVVLLPLVLLADAWWLQLLDGESLVYLAAGWTVLVLFTAVLGMHVGMTYASSRTAIGVSLGTVFFLLLGVAATMRIMVAFGGTFELALQPFLAAMVGGAVGLYVALGHRNPSPAILTASFLLPIATFYALTSYLLGSTLAVLLVVAASYGFTTAALLVPAIYEFDVATGRTHGGEQ